jgi:nitrogen fixation/metabolism regulation signal transduction histidine kinase
MGFPSKKSTSYERKLNKKLALLVLFQLIGLLFFCLHSDWNLAKLMTVVIPLVVATLWVSSDIFKTVLDVFNTFHSSLEHINKGSYNSTPYLNYQQGALSSLSLEYQRLQKRLQENSFGEQKEAFVVYQLIEQLDTPVLLFDHKRLLIKANKTSASFLGKDWRMVKGASLSDVGLKLNINGQVTCNKTEQNWSVKSCISTMGNNQFYLVVLQDIGQALREKELSSWQQLIKVIGHEVRNSLTPIYSLSNALADTHKSDDATHQALMVIANRSKSLQEFVNNTTKLSDIAQPQPSNIELHQLLHDCCSLIGIFDYSINSEINSNSVNADKAQLEQVLINLLKNAQESTEKQESIQISINQSEDGIIIAISDQGVGIYESNNLFTPFYTTKKTGSGIGLPLSKKIIEAHNGRIWVENNKSGQGVTASVWLPN